ncbi:MAG TPA: DUF3788 family protein [Prolixibacteraceae bacterium]|jgi:hypothetical protein
MEPIVLTDRFTAPTDEFIFSIIGDKKIFWKRIMNYLHENHTDISEVWRYYNDGKCWLFRTLKKKKTIFWVGIIDGTFRVSFYLADNAILLIAQSDLSERIKNEYANTQSSRVGRSITIKINDAEDVENVIKLIEIKLKLK